MKNLLAILLLLLTIPSAARRHISVTDFGAIPDDERSDTEALRQAAAYAREHKNTTIVFPAGIYDLDDEMAIDIERRAISGALGRGLEVQWKLFQPQKPYVTGLDFSGARGLVIEATGAVLRVEGWMQVLSFVGCKNVMLKGLSITYKRPAATEGRVVRTSAEDFDIAFDPQVYAYVDSIVQGRYYFFSAEKKHFYYGGIGQTELLRPGLARIRSNVNPPIGDVLVIRYGGHYRPCIMIKESERIQLKDISIRSFPGMGIVGHLSKDIDIDGLRIAPEDGRYSSTNTDATHFTSCSGSLTIRNSSFAGNGDDCTNVHNYYYHLYPDTIDRRHTELRIEGADLHAQSLDYPTRGDTMALISRKNMSEIGRYVVKKVNISEKDWRVDVVLDKPLPAQAEEQAFMYNRTRFPRVRILNNKVIYHNARAFLLKARDVEVSGNQISGCTHSAIKLGAELSWKEAGPVEHVVIKDNVISHTGTDANGYRATGVMITTEAPETPPQVNKNIDIFNNTFISERPVVILLEDAENVNIHDNIYRGGHEIKQQNCSNVKIEGN